MREFVAVRRTTRLVGAGLNLAAAEPAEKRQFLRKEAVASPRTLKLEAAGLEPTELAADRRIGRSRSGTYTRLGYIGAYVVRAESENQEGDARAILENDYELAPNVDLGLPVSARTEIRGSKRGGHEWPDHTGISVAHSRGIKGEGVRVLVLDTGCDADHIQFANKQIDFRYIDPLDPRRRRAVRGFDTHGHGTHVCGILSGKDVGVAPAAELYVAAVIESESVETSLERVLTGLDWLMSEIVKPDAEDSTTILNMSLGLRPSHLESKAAELSIKAVRLALRTLVDEFDVLPVVAAGNDGRHGPGHLRYPGAFPEVLCVGAVDKNGRVADFSSSGMVDIDGKQRNVPDVFGLGVDVYSALERNSQNRSKYAEKSGTSMAAPYVAGVAALLAQATGLQGSKLKEEVLRRTSQGFVRFE